jgi:hypothetical protein
MHPEGKPRRTWAFVMTLCHSRHQYVEFVWDQSSATRLGCHRRAFEWFDGVPERVTIDNAKCAIVKACRFDPLVQRAYAECAGGYGFKIDACPPHDPQKKGIVESGVKYVKGNFLPTRTFRDLADLNAQTRQWVMEEAGTRVHGSTREQPLALYALEAPLLRRLPAVAPDLGTWHRVVLHRDCHVQHDRAFYSAPLALAGKTLWLRATDSVVALYEDYRHLAPHLRAQRACQRVTLADHLPPEARHFFERDRRWCASQTQAIGPRCTELVARLLGDRIAERLRAAQGVLAARSKCCCGPTTWCTTTPARSPPRCWPRPSAAPSSSTRCGWTAAPPCCRWSLRTTTTRSASASASAASSTTWWPTGALERTRWIAPEAGRAGSVIDAARADSGFGYG